MSLVKTVLKKILPSGIVQRMRRVLLRRHLKRFENRVAEHSYLGYRLRVAIRDSLAEGWYDRDWTEMPEVEFLRRSRLKRGATVFDVGAHQGLVAMVLARVVGDTGLVVAVEGTHHNTEVAVENCVLNDIRNVRVVHAVAAESAGLTLSFSESLNGAVGGDLSPTQVSSVSIDSLANKHRPPDVVFVDVEGYECQVLEGSKQTIEAGADFFVEVHAGGGLEQHGSVEQILAKFNTTKYDIHWSEGEQAVFQPLKHLAVLPQHKFFICCLARHSQCSVIPRKERK